MYKTNILYVRNNLSYLQLNFLNANLVQYLTHVNVIFVAFAKKIAFAQI